MISLPEEIWREIISFLDHQDISQLLSVNHVVREVALDRQYEHASLNLGALGQKEYLQQMSHLGDTHVSRRIRRLSIATAPGISKRLDDYHNGRGFLEEVRDSVRLKVGRLQNRLRGRRLSKTETAHSLLHSFRNVQDVEFFCIDDTEKEDFVRQMPLLLSSLKAYSSNLTSIGFSIAPLIFLFDILPQLPHFPSLERISLRLTCYGFANRANEFGSLLKDVVAPFINQHRNTLSFLQAFTNSFSNDYDLSPLVEQLAHIPHLKTLELPFKRKSLPDHPIGKLLSGHSETLRTLVLFVPLKASVLSDDDTFTIIRTPLPYLRELTISNTIRVRQIPHTPSPDLLNYVSGYSSELSKFAMDRKLLVPADWKSLSQMNWSHLISLSLRLALVTPEVFDTLSDNFKALTDLSLIVSAFGESLEATDTDACSEHVFCERMSARKYPKSRLTHLDMHHESYENVHRHFEILSPCAACIAAVVEALPGLVFVNDHSRANFLKVIGGGLKKI